MTEGLTQKQADVYNTIVKYKIKRRSYSMQFKYIRKKRIYNI